MTSPPTPDLVAVAHALRSAIRGLRDESERDRHLPPALLKSLLDAGFFRMLLPADLGGLAADLPTGLRVIEELAAADGAVGWNVMIAVSSSTLAGGLTDSVAREIFGPNGDQILVGVVNPRHGRAVPTVGGYQVSGRWGFGSGIQQAAWVSLGCIVTVDGAPSRDAAGAPRLLTALLPVATCTIEDTWRVGGLRGTGSHDFSVAETFVPAERMLPYLGGRPVRPEPIYAFPVFGLLSAVTASVGLGIARSAIEALIELATTKTPTGMRSTLRERAVIQADVARAQALLQSARCWLYETVAEVWAQVSAGQPATLAQRGALRLASTHAVMSAAEAVDLMYQAGGASAIYESSLLERCFRDIHVVTQHISVAPANYETVGQALLGLNINAATL